MYSTYALSLNRGVTLTRDRSALLLTCGDRCLRVSHPDDLTAAALAALASGFLKMGDLRRLQEQRPLAEVFACRVVLNQLDNRGWLAFSVMGGSRPVMTMFPTEGLPRIAPIPDDNAFCVLSRLAYVRRQGSGLMLTAPLSGCDVALLGPEAVNVVGRLATPATMAEMASADEPGVARECFTLLRQAGAICECSEDGSTIEDANEPLTQWEAHDLIFHLRSREGFHQHSMGGTFRFSGRIDPQTMVRSKAGANVLTLPRPEERTEYPDAQLFAVLERRRSIREHGQRSLTLQELSEFLYRSARLTSVHSGEPCDVGTKPYPSGGGIHELEVYLIATRCDGLPPGMYRYRPLEHALEDLHVSEDAVAPLLRDAAAASLKDTPPHVLVVIAARFQRLSWKYEGIAYSLVLKHVGCLLQTMYLVATAMHLAPCAIGGGNARVFADLIGDDGYVEPSVGEFMLGTRSS